jgi:hypothetical protein
MKALHLWKNLSIEKDVGDDTGFLLANKKGGYASLTFPNISRYNGFFIFDSGEMFKILDEIRIKDAGKIRQLKNHFYCADADFERCSERFFVPSKTNSLAVSFDKQTESEILFDMKKSYDNDDMGRHYSVDIKDGKATIKYTKTRDGAVDYELYAVVVADGKIEKKDEWVKKEFSLDKKRNSAPFERYSYSCLKIKASSIVITAYADIKKAEKESSKVSSSCIKLLEEEKKTVDNFGFPTNISLNVGFSYLACWNSLKGLASENKMFAGLPWFFQPWARDSAISIKALIDIGEHKLAKTMLSELLFMLDYEGNVKSLIGKESKGCLNSADAIGWIFLRYNHLIDEIKEKDLLRSILTKKEEKELIKIVEQAVFLVDKFKTEETLAYNDANETWMDTNYETDTRKGFRIEIQALRLAMYKSAFEFTGKKEFKEKEDGLKEKVYKYFWNRNYLDDGFNDPTIRPNIFLAAYVYPELLSKEEWINCFEYILPHLWLEWGGVSTIDKNSKLFCDEYTGENNRSYHRGDSWFWLNNYAAIAMNKTGSEQFKQKIDKITEASCDEILWKGIIGCHAELSSAKELRSEGCWDQLWSNASFIELVNELYIKK